VVEVVEDHQPEGEEVGEGKEEDLRHDSGFECHI
jgi:hypothetical protein